MGSTVTRLVQDPLAVNSSDNQLCMQNDQTRGTWKGLNARCLLAGKRNPLSSAWYLSPDFITRQKVWFGDILTLEEQTKMSCI